MKRFLIQDLIQWKNSAHRKPLILEGARQVGKTWLLKEFGKTQFKNLVYINCDNNPQIEPLFFDFDVHRIIRSFSAITEQPIVAGETLIFIDEIQEVPKAITSLKYFCENANAYHIVAAGSLLGLTLHEGTDFPVGKVDRMMLYPLSFMEFLYAMQKSNLADFVRAHNWAETVAFSTQLTELLRQYYFTGGMPEPVLSYVTEQNLGRVREIQKTILRDYESDISKHAGKTESIKISLVWNSIPSQLAKENKKFLYGLIKSGGRAKEFENAIVWLMNAGLVHKVTKVKKMSLPLKFYEDFSSFKLFVNDVGLLGAMVDAPAAESLIGNNAFSNYKGSFTEQFVCQQFLCAANKNLFYYTNDNSTLEIDFVFQGETVIPIEVKAEENLRSKSLSTVLAQNPNLRALRFSMSPYREQQTLTNVPLYLAEEFLQTC